MQSLHFENNIVSFAPIPENWTLDGHKDTDGLLALRSDLDPEADAAHVADWLAAGATVVGGCCGTRPALIDEASS